MFRFAQEGYPFVIVFAVATVLTYIFGSPWMALLLLCITIFVTFFFRDPERKIPEEEGVFVSPADGKVILIRDVYEKDYLKSDMKKISIFISPFDVHVNRAPCDGSVSAVEYLPGKSMAAFKADASVKNKSIVMVIDGKEGKVLVRQVAGFIARRAVCKAKVGDVLKRGERYGIIKFGSRVDLYLPKDTKIKVKLGDKIKSGETVVGEIRNKNTLNLHSFQCHGDIL